MQLHPVFINRMTQTAALCITEWAHTYGSFMCTVGLLYEHEHVFCERLNNSADSHAPVSTNEVFFNKY